MYRQQISIDRETFFRDFPKKEESEHKTSRGKLLLISGSFGMAGAAMLNIIGAKAVGAPYINVALPQDIYPVVALRHITPVYFPYSSTQSSAVLSSASLGVSAIAFGSGAMRNPDKDRIMSIIMDSSSPLVLDADALGLLDLKALAQRSAPTIITPHTGEFSRLTGLSIDETEKDRVRAALDFSESFGAITVLKGPGTVVASPDGRYYVNQTGSQALAQAGSGDVLTGISAAMLLFVEDPFAAACDAVFFHGLIADEGLKEHSMQCFPLEEYVSIADRIFKERSY